VLHQNLAWFRHWLLGEELELEPTPGQDTD
jgi:hypothetical protein